MDINTKDSGWISWTKDFKKKKLTETLELTYKMLKQGKSIEQIAKEREFKKESIERHVIELITKSIISVEDVISKNKIDLILNSCEKIGVESLSKLKEDLDEKIEYYEIKCVLAYLSSKPDKVKKN